MNLCNRQMFTLIIDIIRYFIFETLIEHMPKIMHVYIILMLISPIKLTRVYMRGFLWYERYAYIRMYVCACIIYGFWHNYSSLESLYIFQEILETSTSHTVYGGGTQYPFCDRHARFVLTTCPLAQSQCFSRKFSRRFSALITRVRSNPPHFHFPLPASHPSNFPGKHSGTHTHTGICV